MIHRPQNFKLYTHWHVGSWSFANIAELQQDDDVGGECTQHLQENRK